MRTLAKLFFVIALTIIFALMANIIRFHVSAYMNKFILSTTVLLLPVFLANVYGLEHLDWMLLFFIVLSGYSFKLTGGLTAAVISLPLAGIESYGSLVLISSVYLIIGAGSGYISKYLSDKNSEHNRWLYMLLEQSKHLQVFREVSTTMQRTLQQDLLLKVILTSVTAGHGLGFNRAMIFLSSPETHSLKGVVGVGPMDVKKGYEVWEKISEDKLKIRDLIEHNFDSNFTDPELNDILKSLEIPYDEHNVFGKCLLNQQPIIVKKIDSNDISQTLIQKLFKSEEFAVIPLINQGKKMGILFIDNLVDKRPITLVDTENILPLANQAAIALDHANLYGQIEEMALKDGLTGLLNQHAFQTFFNEKFSDGNEAIASLSLLIFDIDYFKVFNDKNGHLLGNEVLTKLAEITLASIRPEDYAFRFGGEEFVVILPSTSLHEAEKIAEELRRNVESASFPGEENQPNGTLTISIGAACTEQTTISSKNELIDAADKALYKAKHAGKNTVVTYKELVQID